MLTGEYILCRNLCKLQGESDEILYTQAFRTELEYRVCREFGKLLRGPSAAVSFCMDEWLERVAEGLATLVESGLDHRLEQRFVTSELLT